ncbi:MAG: hypothetical protein MI748_16320 [Opitutales bacterium]|nr:hypothetical protein [Opitutales bacterium]
MKPHVQRKTGISYTGVRILIHLLVERNMQEGMTPEGGVLRYGDTMCFYSQRFGSYLHATAYAVKLLFFPTERT